MDQINRPTGALHLNRSARVALVALFLSLFAAPTRARAQSPEPPDLPESTVELGNAFVSAWLSFRRDLDSLDDAELHPALLELWFKDMPLFLAEDAAWLATSHHVILAAASRVAEIKGDRGRGVLARLESAYAQSPLQRSIAALRIKAGDVVVRDSAYKDLASDNLERWVRAAQVLAEAGNARGFSALRRALKRGGKRAEPAAVLLGCYGSTADEAALARARARNPEDPTLASAYGEIVLRRMFPHHYAAIVRRGAVFDRIDTAGTMYDSWFSDVGEAIKHGAKGSEQITAAVDEMKRGADADPEPELRRRQLKALVEHWRAVDDLIAGATGRPEWPSSFGEAMDRMSDTAIGAAVGPGYLSKRIAAEISVVVWAADRLRYGRLARLEPGLKLYTSNGQRAVDGNFATAWYALKGAVLTIESDREAAAESLWIAAACKDRPKARVVAVEVTGSGAGEKWTVAEDLDKESLYFQEVPLDRRSARRFDVKVVDTTGREPACVPEIRLFVD